MNACAILVDAPVTAAPRANGTSIGSVARVVWIGQNKLRGISYFSFVQFHSYSFVFAGRTGNILISGEYPNLRMNLLDCGLVLEMGPDQHINLVKVLGAFTRKDGTLAGNLMVDLKSETQASPEDIALFVRGIEQICEMDAEHVSVMKGSAGNSSQYFADALLVPRFVIYLSCRILLKKLATTLRTFATWRAFIA